MLQILKGLEYIDHHVIAELNLNDPCFDILNNPCNPVSYTHLTLPTNREV